MNTDPSHRRLLQRAAIVGALLVICIIGLSAFMRLSADGLSCQPWPQCYADATQAQQQGVARVATADNQVVIARVLHRLFAILLLPLTLVLLFAGFTARPQRWPGRWLAVAALVVVLFLAVLGRATAGARLPAVTLGNLLGGFVLFALFWRMAALPRAPAPVRHSSTWHWLAVFCLIVQIALGALVSGSHAALSCQALLECPLPTPLPWSSLNAWQVPVFDPHTAPWYPDGALPHWLHRAGAAICAVALLMSARYRAAAGDARGAALLVTLTLCQIGLGLLAIANALPLAVVLAHNLLAALLLAVAASAVALAPAPTSPPAATAVPSSSPAKRRKWLI